MRTPASEATVAGLAGWDRLLFPHGEIVRGGKNTAVVREAPGYFGYNAAAQLASEGIRTRLATVVGEDDVAARVCLAVRARGVELAVTALSQYPTPSSTILVEGDQRTIFRTAGSAGEHWTAERFPWDLLREGETGWLLLGHLPADQDGALTNRIARVADYAGITVSWTPGSTQLRRGAAAFGETLARLRLLVMNREEAAAFLGWPDPGRAGSTKTALALADHCGTQTLVVVTDGGAGPAVCVAGRDTIRLVPPLTVQPVDCTGAGDSFHAALAAGLIRGEALDEALDGARRSAAGACTVWGGGGAPYLSPRPQRRDREGAAPVTHGGGNR